MSKRHRVDQKLETKYKALVELEKGKSNKEVAQSFGIPPNTLSTWKKNKEKVFEAYNKGNAKTKRMKSDTYEQVNNAFLLAKKLKRHFLSIFLIIIDLKSYNYVS